ncbi:hypothetical protein [Paraburkholderia sp. J12]|uniref:hypothetical protein n=1 Tax=Paraburkholderia sp. J12 TaxID=2805432 RepID=UPI002ABE0C62|nr:hypothetical protein [Paraburkholderia sp. J12]
MEKLPASVQEIADVIGAEKALNLVRNLPTYYSGKPGKKYHRPLLYVPKRITHDHLLVHLLGFQDAAKMVHYFGGECLQPAGCSGNKGGRPKKNPRVETMDSEAQNPDVIHDGVLTMQTTAHGASCA